MIKPMAIFSALALTLSISAATTSSAYAQDQRTTEMYYIFDIKTTASQAEVTNAIVKGLKKNAPKMRTNSPLVMGPVPVQPKRFEIVDMADQFSNSSLAGLMQMAQMQGGGVGLKQAKCDGAVWIGNFTRDITNQTLNMTTCLFPYQGGYSLNVYGQDTHRKSGLLHRRLVESAVGEVLGKPQKWTQKTFSRLRRKVHEKTGDLMVLVEGQPQIDFSFEGEPVPQIADSAAAPLAVQSAPAQTSKPTPINSPVIGQPVKQAVPSIDCTGLSDADCIAAVRAGSQ